MQENLPFPNIISYRNETSTEGDVNKEIIDTSTSFSQLCFFRDDSNENININIDEGTMKKSITSDSGYIYASDPFIWPKKNILCKYDVLGDSFTYDKKNNYVTINKEGLFIHSLEIGYQFSEENEYENQREFKIFVDIDGQSSVENSFTHIPVVNIMGNLNTSMAIINKKKGSKYSIHLRVIQDALNSSHTHLIIYYIKWIIRPI